MTTCVATKRHFAPVLAAASLIMVLFGSRAASAGEEEQVWRRALSVDAHLEPTNIFGPPTPYGLYGLSASVSPVPWLAVEGGAGADARNDAQFTLMPRLRILTSGQNAFSVGMGASVGAYTWREVWFDSAGSRKTWAHAWRSDLEGSYEFRSLGGFSVRPYLGLAFLLNRSDGVCQYDGMGDHCATVHRDDPSPLSLYTGISLGYAFLAL